MAGSVSGCSLMPVALALEPPVLVGGSMTFKLDRVQELFPTPLVIGELEQASKLNPLLMAEVAERRREEKAPPRTNRHGWQSRKDLFDRTEPGHRELAAELTKIIIGATRQMAPDADLASLNMACEGWINVNPPGGYNSPHAHPGAFWSGCYYVETPANPAADPDGGAIEFMAHRPANFFVKTLPAPMTVDKVRIHPKPGMVLLFPGTVNHWVFPHQGPGDRVTIAFNAQFRQRPASAARPRS